MPGDREGRMLRWLFLGAGVYGLLAVAPLWLRPAGADGAAAFFRYAFAGAAGATQLLYLAIGSDFRRFRPLIWVGVASKLSFAIPCLLLIGEGRLDPAMLPFAIIDLLLAAAFAAASAMTRRG
ncbi:hypothetical protein [Sphingomonas profundi]|uniref:hypothetical protein n=1 Tax=Alterirhizorhabdus profundi TaxID=2681549 RepID=UPI0012E87C64|nr:hypothetical protein [Sphingomonas profundi]